MFGESVCIGMSSIQEKIFGGANFWRLLMMIAKSIVKDIP
jgi:hypothetical protein